MCFPCICVVVVVIVVVVIVVVVVVVNVASFGCDVTTKPHQTVVYQDAVVIFNCNAGYKLNGDQYLLCTNGTRGY